GLGGVEEEGRGGVGNGEGVEAAQARSARRGESQRGVHARCRAAWAKAERAMDAWQEGERHWQDLKDALQVFTPEGELNTRAQAEAQRTEALKHLPGTTFAKAKRLLGQAATFTYLDEVHRQLEALPVPAEIRQAAVRQEGLRQRPEALSDPSPRGAALRGVLLACVVVLAKAGPVGAQAVACVRSVLRHT